MRAKPTNITLRMIDYSILGQFWSTLPLSRAVQKNLLCGLITRPEDPTNCLEWGGPGLLVTVTPKVGKKCEMRLFASQSSKRGISSVGCELDWSLKTVSLLHFQCCFSPFWCQSYLVSWLLGLLCRYAVYLINYLSTQCLNRSSGNRLGLLWLEIGTSPKVMWKRGWNFRFHKCKEFLTSWGNNFSYRALLLGVIYLTSLVSQTG
jgi:hypothetical protein